MRKVYHYATVIEALKLLKEKGFEYDYNINDQEIIDNPDNFEIEHIYRYEGNSNPDDESMVYGIKSKSGQKGVFVAGFAANSFNGADKILIDLSIRDFS
ncbi:hypothetical protein [uncultured Flavobacterium sp.]|uniref:hypothetical protein n=1 Tax=uncultured Flavobacterium sp. TaxID=165435 RepID=UPI0030EF18F2|tara:strand:- start:18138 stop:18434 length:297 start_codon:yes stop_codon:yes gene_type:complete